MEFKDIPPLSAPLLLKKHGLHADKRLGQNFLQDAGALERIVRAADITQEALVLEVGSGLGSLTRYLAAAAGRVVAVELDKRLIPVLKNVLKPYSNITIVAGDILKLSSTQLALSEGYIVVANIPYNLTSAIIRHLLESSPRPQRMILTVQREVAERICANPPDMSLLALSVQVYGKPAIVTHIPAGAFFPAPKVDSAAVRIDIHPTALIPSPELEIFFKLIKAAFSQKRKTLRNSLSAGLKISTEQSQALLIKAGIDPQRRAETISLEEWNILCGFWRP